MDSVGAGEKVAATAMSNCQRMFLLLSHWLVSLHSFKIQTSEAFLVDGLFELLFTRIIRG